MSPLVALLVLAQPDLPAIVSRYSEDLSLIERAYPIPSSPTRATRLRKFYEETGRTLDSLDFDRLPREDHLWPMPRRGRKEVVPEPQGLR